MTNPLRMSHRTSDGNVTLLVTQDEIANILCVYTSVVKGQGTTSFEELLVQYLSEFADFDEARFYRLSTTGFP